MWLEVRFEAANPDRVGTFRRKTSECEANYNRADAPLLLLLLNEYYLHAVKQKSCKSMLQKTHNAICQIVPFPMAFNDP